MHSASLARCIVSLLYLDADVSGLGCVGWFYLHLMSVSVLLSAKGFEVPYKVQVWDSLCK